MVRTHAVWPIVDKESESEQASRRMCEGGERSRNERQIGGGVAKGEMRACLLVWGLRDSGGIIRSLNCMEGHSTQARGGKDGVGEECHVETERSFSEDFE